MDGSGFPSPVVTRDVPDKMADRLIAALDFDTPAAALRLIEKLDGVVSFFKIGMGLFIAEGSEKVVETLISQGKNVFLDYKMFDIPETVKQGVARARERGVKFVTVHGDEQIISAAVEGKNSSDNIKVFAITVLTSLSDPDLLEMGYRLTVEQLIELRVKNSIKWGCDGIIASAQDNPNKIREFFKSNELLIATPGIRMPGEPQDDHKRLATPEQAIRDGADYLVVGRPIWTAADPARAAEGIIANMELGRTD